MQNSDCTAAQGINEVRMKVRILMMVDDARFAPLGRSELIEGFDIDREACFLDGPATDRVIVLDRDQATGQLLACKFCLPAKGRILGRYDIPCPVDTTSRAFNQVSVFATVLKTIYMYEEPDTLGRRIRWAFDSPQLIIVPRSGIDENAFYSRAARSLKFYSFPSHQNSHHMVHTSLARDIVAHETGHAILDGIAPRLWDAITPQSLALHEAIADLTALLVSMRSRTLSKAVLKSTKGSIEHSTHFSAIAEEFGFASGSGALRDLKNDLSMSDVDASRPHDLSQVLTGALYSVLIKMHDGRKKVTAARKEISEYSVSGYALYGAAQHFKRMILRALDYLPPGEASFADYGRAILAADQASHPDDAQEREWLIEEFVRRGIVADQNALDVRLPGDGKSDWSEGVDRAALADDDRAVHQFAGSAHGRQLFGIPDDVPFHVEPRLRVTKTYYHRVSDQVVDTEEVQECLFKVCWQQEEPNPLGPAHPPKRAITVGTTLSWDWNTGRLRALLTSDHRARPQEEAEQQAGRDLFMRRLWEDGYLQGGRRAMALNDEDESCTLTADIIGDSVRLRGVGQMLHLAGEL